MTIAYFAEVMRRRFILKKVVDIQFRTSLLKRKRRKQQQFTKRRGSFYHV